MIGLMSSAIERMLEEYNQADFFAKCGQLKTMIDAFAPKEIEYLIVDGKNTGVPKDRTPDILIETVAKMVTALEAEKYMEPDIAHVQAIAAAAKERTLIASAHWKERRLEERLEYAQFLADTCSAAFQINSPKIVWGGGSAE